MLGPGVESLIRRALQEDIGSGDITTRCTVPAGVEGRGRILARQQLVLAGTLVAREVFWAVERSLEVVLLHPEGRQLGSGETLIEVAGDLAAMLTAERTALNFLQRLSGIATLTRAYVQRVAGTPARILDTRKTTPGWRWLEKAAVRAGGGSNHRFGLYDGVLIKDNHIAAAGSIRRAVAAVRAQGLHTLKVEVEVETLEQLQEAIAAGADVVLLDNMEPQMVAEAVRLAGGRVRLEASGSIALHNVREIATTGVDFISVGALTHSAPAVDINMEIAGGAG